MTSSSNPVDDIIGAVDDGAEATTDDMMIAGVVEVELKSAGVVMFAMGTVVELASRNAVVVIVKVAKMLLLLAGGCVVDGSTNGVVVVATLSVEMLSVVSRVVAADVLVGHVPHDD